MISWQNIIPLWFCFHVIIRLGNRKAEAVEYSARQQSVHKHVFGFAWYFLLLSSWSLNITLNLFHFYLLKTSESSPISSSKWSLLLWKESIWSFGYSAIECAWKMRYDTGHVPHRIKKIDSFQVRIVSSWMNTGCQYCCCVERWEVSTNTNWK